MTPFFGILWDLWRVDFIHLSYLKAANNIWSTLFLADGLGLDASQMYPPCSSIVRKTIPQRIQRLGSFCLRHLGGVGSGNKAAESPNSARMYLNRGANRSHSAYEAAAGRVKKKRLPWPSSLSTPT